jgi:hypothetical protein
MAKYTVPPGFILTRAQELAALVNAAYDQLDASDNKRPWVPPAGYKIIGELSAKEGWKAPGLFGKLLGELNPVVPFGFVATKNTDTYIVIRGTRTPLEWLDDFAARPEPFLPDRQDWGRTTLGFKLLYDDLGPQIMGALGKVGDGGLKSIFVTGHSLGAALAHLAAAGTKARYPGATPVSYTFCGPRTGDPAFAAKFAAAKLPTWRVVNTEDVVPTVPPAAVEFETPNAGVHPFAGIGQDFIKFIQLSPAGYQHVGYPVAVTFHKDTISGNHNLDSLVTELAS